MSKKILIVDDEVDLVNLLRVRFESYGYTVISAFDGGEGVKLALKEKPDLILLDIMMPKMDGYTALKILKGEDTTKDIPVIMLTAKGKMKDLFEPEGIKGYLVKPFEKEHLLQTIKGVIGGES